MNLATHCRAPRDWAIVAGMGVVVAGMLGGVLAPPGIDWSWLGCLWAALGALLLAGLLALLRRRSGRARTQRTRDLAVMAGGLAHELRHPINAVRFSLASAVSRIAKMEPESLRREVSDICGEIQEDVARLEEIIDAFLRYARPEAQDPAPCDLTETCRAAARFVRADMANRSLVLNVDLPDREVQVLAPRIHMLQVLMNLILNAADASEPGGHIELRLTSRKRRATVEVADGGHGVPGELRARILEPFFSTKEGGAGLGLAISSRLVADAGGTLSYRPGERVGSVFTVNLPLMRSNA